MMPSPVAEPGFGPGKTCFLPALPCNATLAAGFNVIQPAIDAAIAGAVICLAPGIYTQIDKLLKVNKGVELRGPQFGIDPRPTAGSTRSANNTNAEAIIVGSVELSEANNAILEGLVFKDGIETEDGTIFSRESTSNTGVKVLFSIIFDATDDLENEDNGVYLWNCINCLIEYNHVFNLGNFGMRLRTSVNSIIRHNELYNTAVRGIYVRDSNGIQINNNMVSAVDIDGIRIKDSPNCLIQGNVVHDIGENGIHVDSSDNTVVVDNEVFDNGPLDFPEFLDFEDGSHLQIYGDGITNIIIKGNLIGNNTKFFGILLGRSTRDPDAAGISINNNCIEGNVNGGLLNNIRGRQDVDAENNWWGSASGPSPGGAGDMVEGDVDFFPFLAVRPACGAPPIMPAIPPCKECAEFPCGFRKWNKRFVCSSLKISSGSNWFDDVPKMRCVKDKNVAKIFEEDPNAMCGPCP